MIDKIELNDLRMNHFTELDALLYCQLSLINPDNIKILYLFNNNKLTNISGVSIFKNLEHLYIYDNKIRNLNCLKDLINLKTLQMHSNKITNINPLKNLNKLEDLSIDNLNLTDESDAVNILKSLNNLKYLGCKDTFKTVDIRNELKIIAIYDR